MQSHMTAPSTALARTEALRFRVSSRSRKGRHHHVTYLDGAWNCNCEGFKYRSGCWAVDACRRWLESILPAERLPGE